jgi:hypothetical protein
MKLYCNCCGEPLGTTVALVSPSTLPVDRVFVVNPEHLERLDEMNESIIVTVAEQQT